VEASTQVTGKPTLDRVTLHPQERNIRSGSSVVNRAELVQIQKLGQLAGIHAIVMVSDFGVKI